MKNIEIISKLASGVNPLNGESLSDDDLYSNPVIIRALFSAMKAMTKESNTNNSTLKEKQKENVQKGKPKNAGMPWTQELKDELSKKFKNGSMIEALSIHFQRTEGAMKAELVRQGLIDASELDYPVRGVKIKTDPNDTAFGKTTYIEDEDDDLPFS